MKTEVQLKSKQITIEDLKNTDHVGFIPTYAKGKGYILFLGEEQFMPVDTNQATYNCNCLYQNGQTYETLVDAVKGISIATLYRFDTRKELYQWLAE